MCGYAVHEEHVKLIMADGGINFGICGAYLFWSTGGSVCVQANKDARLRPQVAQEKVSTLLKALTLDAYADGSLELSEPITESGERSLKKWLAIHAKE